MKRAEALSRLRARCSRAEYCSGQVIALLERWIAKEKRGEEGAGGDETVTEVKETGEQLCVGDIEQIVATLKSEKFVDDSRFANAYVRDKLNLNGWGRSKIVYGLRSLGIPQYIVDEAIKENYYGDDGAGGNSGSADAARRVLERLLEKRWRATESEGDIHRRRNKVIRFALSRGFEYEMVTALLEQLVKGGRLPGE